MEFELKTIRFDNNYPKLHGQKQARLVMLVQCISGYLLLNTFPDFAAYDTKRDDGRYYNIEPEVNYMLLLFVGEKGILFPTFRKQNQENVKLYAESVGELFNIKIEPKGVKYGREQRNQRQNY